MATLWTGFTSDRYGVVLENDNIVCAARNSLIVASSATTVSTLMAIAAVLGMAGRRFKGQQVLNGLIALPLLVPVIVTAVMQLMF